MGTVVAGEAVKERTVGTVEPLIQLRGLEKAYDQGGSKFFVLRRINLDILAGEFVTIMGPSGAGKSTLFQSYHLIDNLTVFENLDIPLSYKNVPHKERTSLVCDSLDRFQIVGKKDLFPSQLSGGQQQLVAVARALIMNPKLILADEPTGNLHSAQGEEIMQLFKRLNEAGTTIIQVTHSERNAAFGHRIIQLKDGWIVSGDSSAAAAR